MAGGNPEPARLTFSRKYQPIFRRDLSCRYFLITGGRGSGKSYAISTAVGNDQATADYNTLYLRQTLVSAHISIIPEFWEKLQLLGLEGNFIRSQADIRNLCTGWHIFFRGIQTSRGSNEASV